MSAAFDRVALITGCGKTPGIGSATARALSRAGYRLAVSDIAPSGVANDNDDASAAQSGGLDRLVGELVDGGSDAFALTGDVSSEADAARMVDDVLDRYGRLDVLVNNAGAPHGEDRGDIETVSLAAWERVMAVNVRGVFLMSRAAVGPMRRQRFGRIVNIASAIVKYAVPRRTPYITSKAAVVAFTEALALDVADSGITVNAVCPGSVRTTRAISSTRKAGYADIEAGMRERARGIPLGRHGEADEIAATVAFLASDAAAYVTGSAVYVDGGGLPR